MTVSRSTIDSVRLGGISVFATWCYSPKRRFFENKVKHPFTFELSLPDSFCPQLHQTRKRIKLKSLAWARTHRKRLYCHPRIYALAACDQRNWQADASKADKWGSLWDNIPYNVWGMDQQYWYYQRHELIGFDDFPGVDHFCSTLDPLVLNRIDSQTKSLLSDLSVPKDLQAFAAAHSLQDQPDHLSQQFYSVGSDGLPVVVDSGASSSVTPCLDDFIGALIPLKDEKVDGITESAIIEEIGLVNWQIVDDHGRKGTICCLAYYMPKAKIRLFSPQKYFQEKFYDGPCVLTSKGCTLTLEDGVTLEFLHNKYNNLPMGKLHSRDSALSMVPAHLPEGVDILGLLHHECNQNLTRPQKDLLHWHWRLGHASQSRIQGLMRKHKTTGQQIIFPQDKKAASCDHPLCTACRTIRISNHDNRAPI